MSHEEAPNQLRVVARAPFEIYFEGNAQSLSAVNKVGPFDILPGHADFFSILEPCEVVIEPVSGSTVNFQIANGIVTVRDNEVLLFADM